MKIPELPESERPRERCLREGAMHLSLRECIAVLLGTGPRGKGCMGVAQELLDRAGRHLSPESQQQAFFSAIELGGAAFFKECSGIGDASLARLLVAFEIGRRYANYRNTSQNPSNKKISLFQRIPNHLRTTPSEWLGFIPLYGNQRAGDFILVENGTRTHVNVEPTELFAQILLTRPRGFYLFHNHPSGSLLASEADRELTRNVHRVAQALGMTLMGHWIITASSESLVAFS